MTMADNDRLQLLGDNDPGWRTSDVRRRTSNGPPRDANGPIAGQSHTAHRVTPRRALEAGPDVWLADVFKIKIINNLYVS